MKDNSEEPLFLQNKKKCVRSNLFERNQGYQATDLAFLHYSHLIYARSLYVKLLIRIFQLFQVCLIVKAVLNCSGHGFLGVLLDKRPYGHGADPVW